MAVHRGRGHAAYTEEDLWDYLLDADVAKTSELAEEFGVSDEAIRKRLMKDIDWIGTRKIRNRRVWYLPHDVREREMYGSGAGALDPWGIVGWARLKSPHESIVEYRIQSMFESKLRAMLPSVVILLTSAVCGILWPPRFEFSLMAFLFAVVVLGVGYLFTIRQLNVFYQGVD